MKRVLRETCLVLTGVTLVLGGAPGCSRSGAAEAPGDAPPSAAHYKEGHGVQLGAEASAFVGLRLAEVEARSFQGGDAAAVPAAALLRTVRGTFVYVENGEWLLRTPVRLGAERDSWVEVVEGLYEGDRVAVAGVDALWMAEISAVNGGVGCADGH